MPWKLRIELNYPASLKSYYFTVKLSAHTTIPVAQFMVLVARVRSLIDYSRVVKEESTMDLE